MENISLDRLTYDPGIFDVDGIERAKLVILNPDGVHNPDERWKCETEYLLNIIDAYLPLRDATALDYGVGIGRMAKPLIEQKNWSVIGADISASMRDLAAGYVNSTQFLACHPSAIDALLPFGLSVDFAISIWALQHMQNVQQDIDRIKRCLKPHGRLFVLNAAQRFIPTREVAWFHDGVDVLALLREAFLPIQINVADTNTIPQPPTWWGIFEKC